LPLAMTTYLLVMATFGGLSYGMFHYYYSPQAGHGWIALAFFVGLFVGFGLLLSRLRTFFGKYTGRLVFGLWLVAVLGSFFVYLFQQDKYPMGIDLAGGTELVYNLDYSATDKNLERISEALGQAKSKDSNSKQTHELQRQMTDLEMSKKTAPEKAAEVVRRRVDPTGTKGIPVTTLGTDKQRLRIQLPKATQEEVDRIKTAIRTQGRLTFHIVPGPDEQQIVEETKRSPTKTYVDPSTKREYELKIIEKTKSITGKKDEEQVVIRRDPGMDGSRISVAMARRSTESVGRWEIGVRFDAAGSADFGKMTEANVKKRMAIMLDGTVHSAPTIQEAIYGECRISGDFDEKEAEKLASVLTAGSLPAEVKLESEFTVGPSLGQEQIQSGMLATAIGSGAVIVFMLVYYRFSGIVASFCTLLNIIMLLGAMGFFKATLTLPGIAGIVLTLGMAVDANVLILERLREELAAGRPMKLAVSHGFDRAFLTIIDCNLTTLISGIVLYYLGTGPVRGFAVTLSIGILTTLFCNLWLNWIITEWLVSKDVVSTFTFMQFFKKPNLRFMHWRKMWMSITGSTVVVSVVLFLVFGSKQYDVDFKGGTLIQFNFAQGKQQGGDKIKQIVDKDVRAGVAQRLAQDIAVLSEAIASNRTGNDLRDFLIQKMPDTGEIVFKDSQGRDNGLADIAAELEGIRKDLPHADLTTQSFGSAGPEGGYHSFTVTTLLQNPLAIKDLREELLNTFKAELEPPPTSLVDKTVQMRFYDKYSEADMQNNLRESARAAAADPNNLDIKSNLVDLQPKNLDKSQPGYVIAELKPLPDDAGLRQKLYNVIKPMKVKGEIGGPISRVNSFGSAVASEMKWQALLALIVANIGVWIYLWFRFEFSGAWGFGAIVALIHDVCIATGGVVVGNMIGQQFGFTPMFNLNTVAALLTIVGFSVNDTIVVFDRIREVKAAHPTRQYEEIVDEAINATLSRTILTSLTVLLADIALLIFGGPTIRDLAFTLLIGFVVGTYSSIYIASPLMIWWYRRFGGGHVPPPSPQKQALDNAVGAQV
jgi:SecD/SecF fusion protein